MCRVELLFLLWTYWCIFLRLKKCFQVVVIFIYKCRQGTPQNITGWGLKLLEVRGCRLRASYVKKAVKFLPWGNKPWVFTEFYFVMEEILFLPFILMRWKKLWKWNFKWKPQIFTSLWSSDQETRTQHIISNIYLVFAVQIVFTFFLKQISGREFFLFIIFFTIRLNCSFPLFSAPSISSRRKRLFPISFQFLPWENKKYLSGKKQNCDFKWCDDNRNLCVPHLHQSKRFLL